MTVVLVTGGSSGIAMEELIRRTSVEDLAKLLREAVAGLTRG